jgi:Na+/proline symporter
VAWHGGIGAALATVDAGRVAFLPASGATSPLGLLEEWAIPVCGSVVATELVSRVIAARSPSVARAGSVAAGGLYITVGLIPVGIGLVAGGVVPAVADTEQLLPAVAREVLPAGLYVLFAGSLISAILSTVDTTLLVSAGLASHNLVAPVLGIGSDHRRLQLARGAVAVFGLVAYLLAVRAEGVFTLVQQASAFGSAGALVVVSFGLFTSWGGAGTALATLVGGLAVYLTASYGGAPYPFITSLAAALTIYVGGATLASARARLHPSRADV